MDRRISLRRRIKDAISEATSRDGVERIDQDTYFINRSWYVKFGVNFGFECWFKSTKRYRDIRYGVYWYTKRIEILGKKKLPPKIHQAVEQIAIERHQEGLMPNK
jgi:hypothetical protein